MNFNPLLYSSSDLDLYPGHIVVLLSLLSYVETREVVVFFNSTCQRLSSQKSFCLTLVECV